MENAPQPIETDYELGQDNVSPFGLEIHNPVFSISALAIAGFVLVTLMFQAQATEFFGWLRPFLTSTFDWFFLSAANIFVLFCFMLLVTPLGSVRLGGPDAKPDYSYMGWFAMLFAAGMGIGLMFFGVSEPMSHFASSMGGTVVEGGARTDWAPLGAATGDAIAARNLGMAATSFIGHFTHGQSMRYSRWLWLSSLTTEVCRSHCDLRSIRYWVKEYGAGGVIPSISLRYSPHCSDLLHR